MVFRLFLSDKTFFLQFQEMGVGFIDGKELIELRQCFPKDIL